VNENLRVESPGARVPRQVAEQAQHARDILAKSGAEQPPPDSAAAPAPPAFTYDELLKAPTPEKDKSVDYWKARCNVTEGHRRQDNDNSRKRIERLELELETLRGKNLELMQQATRTPTPAPPPQVDLRKEMQQRFSADEIESFGEERLLAMTREIVKAGASAEAALAEVRGRLDAMVEQQQSKVKTEEERKKEEAANRHRAFVEELTALFPDWAKVNVDGRWLTWLDGFDRPGVTRQETLNILQGKKDAKGIALMLEEFVKSLGALPVPPEPPETPRSVEGSGQDLRPDPKLGTDQPPMSAAEIREGYARKNFAINGKAKFTPEEAALFDARVEATMKRAGKG
jgi:hypothetical protein